MSTRFGVSASMIAVAALCSASAFAQGQAGAQPRQPAAKSAAQPAGGQPATRQPGQAQQNQQQRPGAQERTANKPVSGDQAGKDQAGKSDQMIAAMLVIGNDEEAMIGKFAAEHASHEQVQKFADMMVKEHTQMSKQLQKWAPDASLANSSQGDASSDSTTTRQKTAAGQGAAMPMDPVKIHKEIAMQCINSSKKELGSKKGADFDMCYIGHQVVVHQQMIDKATVLKRYASSDLAAAIDKGIESAETHLDHAKELIEKLASAEKSGGSRKQ